jgi:hypothetical protein
LMMLTRSATIQSEVQFDVQFEERGARSLLLSLIGAIAVHALIAGTSSYWSSWAEPAAAPAPVAAIEVTLEQVLRADAAAHVAPLAAVLPPPLAEGRSELPAHLRSAGVSVTNAPDDSPVVPESEQTEAEAAEPVGAVDALVPGAADAETPRNGRTRGIDLWAFNDPAVQRRLGQTLAPERQPRSSDPGSESVGRLVEGLAERDAKLGLAKSSVAVNSGYEAARRFAPAYGTAVFEVRADANGHVQSVVVLGGGTNEPAWRRMADHLAQLLSKRRLRLAPGARGLVTRLRIARGSLAEAPPAQRKTKRGVADPRPDDQRMQWNESTQAVMDEKARVSPTIGTNLLAGETIPTTVVVLSEREL